VASIKAKKGNPINANSSDVIADRSRRSANMCEKRSLKDKEMHRGAIKKDDRTGAP